MLAGGLRHLSLISTARPSALRGAGAAFLDMAPDHERVTALGDQIDLGTHW
jgi:hypothetical protein